MRLLLLSLLLLLQAAPSAPGRAGVLAGQLRALDGSPASGVRVAAVAVPPANQTREPGLVPLQYLPPPAALFGITFTDKLGRYRLENIPPGRYYIMAGLNDAPTFYPESKTSSGATVVTVESGSKAENMNFGMLWTLGIKVEGRVIQSGAPASGQRTASLAGSRVDEFLEVPVREGAFEFVRVPVGSFTLSLFPPPPGFKPIGVTITSKSVSGLELVLPPTRTVTGRIAIEGDGPLPIGLLSFYSATGRVMTTINPDGAFTAMLNEARHKVDVDGLPVGYRVSSVRVGSTDASQGFVVGKSNVSDVVVTLDVSRPLPRVSGRVVGLANPSAAAAKVELKGHHILFPLVAAVRADGTFEFPKVLPDLYELSLPAVRGFVPTPLVVTNQSVTNLELTVAGSR